MKILDKFKDTINKHGLLSKKDKVLIGVSGGPDSVALLYLLNGIKREYGLSLHIAHLDHALRKDSRKDGEFVRKLAQGLKIPVTIGRIDIKSLTNKGSLEEIARNARLGFLFQVAKQTKAKKIALGHNLDDQAETVLMRILRGTGLYGLAGIIPKREIAGFEIIRPLIAVTRSEIEAFLRFKKLKALQDASNLEEIYFRNKIRHKLLPLLAKEYNKNIKELLANMAECVGSDYDYLKGVARRAIKGKKPNLNLDKLRKMHPAIRRLVLRQSFSALKGDSRRLTFQHVREIEDLIFNRPQNSVVDLPKGISVVKRQKTTHFYRKNPAF